MPENQSFAIARVYLRNASVELPGVPLMFKSQAAANATANIERGKTSLLEGGTDPNGVEFSVQEVTIRATVTGKVGDATQYLIEAEIGGIFELRQFSPDLARSFLSDHAPFLLMPHLRMALVDLATRATLPITWLPEIDWASVPSGDPAAANDQA